MIHRFGAVEVDEDRREVLVHALTGGKAEGIRAMHDRVLALERGLEAHDRPESDRRGDTVPEENESGPRDRARADADDGAKHRGTGGES